jgi:putative inorganic carbon (hco3(-)) transporter
MSRVRSYPFTLLKEYAFYLILLVLSITIAYATGVHGLKAGAAILAAVIGIAALLTLFYNYHSGFYLLVIYVYYIFVLGPFIPPPIPYGVVIDALCILTLLSMWIHFFNSSQLDREYPFRNLIGYLVIVLVALDFVQLLNPAMTDTRFGFITFRETVYLICTYFIAFQVLNTRSAISFFSILWIILSLTVAFYAIKQEHIGLTDEEWSYLRSDPRRYELYVIWGHVRKWSFLSDPSAYGITMAFCGIFCFVISLRKFNWKLRAASFVCSIIFLVSMTYSGTRTAFGVVPIGIAFYFFMTFDNPRMMAAAVATALIFLTLFFGPFYGPTLNRIRSTFNKEDASMSFRDMKRHILQDYVWRHPIGAGLGSANAISGRLTITADTDSGYLRTAVDKGLVGLLVQFALYFAVMFVGINTFYDSDDPLVKSLLAAYLTAFFAITVANFYQDTVDQKPLNILVACIFAIVLRLQVITNKKNKTPINSNP